ncbi:Ig-like domain-containing protein, partial [Ekhidna sp.]
SVYRWYDNLTGGVPVFTGASYDPAVSTTRNFYVDVITLAGCVSASRTQVEVTVNAIPNEPTTFDASTCGSGIVDLSVGGGPSGSVYNWYETEAGVTAFHTGSTYSTTLSTTTSYWVSILTAEGCEGERAEIVATVNPIPAAPSGIAGDRCGTGNVTLGVSSGIIGVFNWYETEASAVSLGTSNVFVTPVIIATKSFWVDITDASGCTSTRTEVVATVNDIPAAPVADHVERCAAGSVTMTASGSGTGAIYDWFESSSGGTSVFTGASYTTSVTTTKSFYVSATSTEGCVSSSRTRVDATVNPLPGAPVVFDGENCGAGTVSLSVGGASAGGEYRWYTADTGGASFNNSSNYEADISSTTSYWVAIVTPEGCEGVRAEVVATINPIPAAPSPVDGSRCGTGTVSLSATAGSTGVFNWYQTEASVTSVFTGVNFTTPGISSTTSYWVEFTNLQGCVSERTEVVATVNDIPVNPAANDVERCAAGSVTMTASGSGTGAIYDWFESSSGGTSVFTGASYTTSVTTTKSFYVSATSTEGCVSSSRTRVDATVNPLPGAPVVFDGENCGAGTVSLSAGGAPAGGEYRWYTASTGGSSFNNTNSYEANVTETTSYWVSIVSDKGCEGERAEIIATVNEIPVSPNGNSSARCGVGSVVLSASSTSTGTFNWYETQASSVSLFTGVNFNTPSINSTSSYWVDFTDLNGCTSARTEVVATVYDVIPDATVPPVERCGSGTVTISASSGIGGAIFKWYENSFGGTPIFIGSSFTTPTLTLSREYFVLAESPEGCAALNRTPVAVTINPFPSAPSVVNGSICGVGSVDLQATGAPAGGSYRWYDSFSGGTSLATNGSYTTPVLSESTNYYVSIVNAQGCESARSLVIATINDFPDAPTVNDVERCGAGNIQLSGTISGSGTINWYLNSSGGSAFASGTSITVVNVTGNSTYYAATESNEGCESGRVPVNATITPIEPVDLGGNIDVCVNGGELDLAAFLPNGVTPGDGIFAGAGVVGFKFFPSIAGIGNHEVTFFLTKDIGCLDDGSIFITVINITDGGSEVTLSESEVNQCVNDGLLDLNVYPSKSGGTWTINAGEGSLNVGILDPSVAGEGEFVATYTVDVNGCTVQLQMDVNITASPELPEITVPSLVCTGGEATATVSNVTQATDVYYWYRGSESTAFETGSEITLTPTETTSYKVQVENAFGCFSDFVSFEIEVSDTEIEFNSSATEIAVRDRVEFTTDVQATSYAWDFGDGFNSVEQSPAHIYFSPGVYSVTLSVITNEGCDATIVRENLITVSEENKVLGIDEDLKNSLVVYPQPFRDVVRLDFVSSKSSDLSVKMFTLSGNVVHSRVQTVVPGENQIVVDGLDALSRGVYLIRLMDNEGNAKNVKVLKR